MATAKPRRIGPGSVIQFRRLDGGMRWGTVWSAAPGGWWIGHAPEYIYVRSIRGVYVECEVKTSKQTLDIA